MGSIIGGAKPAPIAPAPAPLPPAPARSDAQTQKLADEQRRIFAGGGSRAMTYFTGGGTAPKNSAVSYLGAAGAT